MTKHSILTFTIIFCVFFDISAQIAKGDTVVFIWFDKKVFFSIEHKMNVNASGELIQDFYSYGSSYQLYGGYTLDFYTKGRSQPFFLSKKSAKKKGVLSIEQIKKFIEINYVERRPEEYLNSVKNPLHLGSFGPDPKGSASYWNDLKHIFLVLKNGSDSKFRVVEVELAVNIE
ncbi:MAG: hypothetical protein ACKO96_20585 [Flammeovirgaceae bacterium]